MLLGAHVSTSGGCRNAPARGAAIGAVAIQVFTKQPNRWAEVQIPDDERVAFRVAMAEHGIAYANAHDSYLINLATTFPLLRAQSLAALVDELDAVSTQDAANYKKHRLDYLHARAALAIFSPVMSKPGIAGKQIVARHMRLTLKIGGIGKAVPAGGKALVAPLPQLDRIARRTGEGGRSGTEPVPQ